MEKRYISESRYKKNNSRKRRNSSTVKSNLNLKKQSKTQNNIKLEKNKKINKKTRKPEKNNKLTNIVTCIILITIIAVISRAILKDENEPFIPFVFFNDANEQVIKIGIITEENLLNSNSKNFIINELNKYSKDMLLEINDDYSITYKCISNVIKMSNKEYILVRNNESNVDINAIKETLDKYRTDEQSSYYYKLSNIENITILDNNTLNIKLKSDSPYFIYNLDICMPTSYDLTNYIQQASSTEDKLIFTRNEYANEQLPARVIVTKFKDMYSAVNAYKNQEINMFITNSENVKSILGKYEYNIKTYRNGKTLFLFSNPESEIYSKYEVRKAIAYSIDRDGIINDILKSQGDKIDLPYIYDSVKYKYDVYAAENLLLTSGYKKNNGVYSKVEDGVKKYIQLNLIVNENDDIKIKVANKLKNNLSSIGIKLNIEKLNTSKIRSRIKNGTYDLLLANLDLNNIPDISFVYNNLFITNNIEQAMDNIGKSTINDLNNNITYLQKQLSQEISTIGIYSDISYLIYNKDIVVEDISYMNVFKGVLN